MDDIIRVEGVSKDFKGARVLNNVSVSFEQGKIHGVSASDKM